MYSKHIDREHHKQYIRSQIQLLNTAIEKWLNMMLPLDIGNVEDFRRINNLLDLTATAHEEIDILTQQLHELEK